MLKTIAVLVATVWIVCKLAIPVVVLTSLYFAVTDPTPHPPLIERK